MKKRNQERGFTLIEIIAVLVIPGYFGCSGSAEIHIPAG